MVVIKTVTMETRLDVPLIVCLILVIPAIIKKVYFLFVLQSVEITLEHPIKNVIMVRKLAA